MVRTVDGAVCRGRRAAPRKRRRADGLVSGAGRPVSELGPLHEIRPAISDDARGVLSFPAGYARPGRRRHPLPALIVLEVEGCRRRAVVVVREEAKVDLVGVEVGRITSLHAGRTSRVLRMLQREIDVGDELHGEHRADIHARRDDVRRLLAVEEKTVARIVPAAPAGGKRRVGSSRDEILPHRRPRIVRQRRARVADAVEVRHKAVRHVHPHVQAHRAGWQGTIVDLLPAVGLGDERGEGRLHRAAPVGGDPLHAHLRERERRRVAVGRPHDERIAGRLHGDDVLRRVRGRMEDVHARRVASLDARDQVRARVRATAQEEPRVVVGQCGADGADDGCVECDEHDTLLRGERLRLDGSHDGVHKPVRAVALQLHHALRRLVRREEREVVLELRQRLAFPLRSDPTAERAHAHVLEIVPRGCRHSEVRAGARRAAGRRVMDDHGHADGRGVHVALHAVNPAFEREAERRHRVLGTVLRLAPVRDDLRHFHCAGNQRQHGSNHTRSPISLHFALLS